MAFRLLPALLLAASALVAFAPSTSAADLCEGDSVGTPATVHVEYCLRADPPRGDCGVHLNATAANQGLAGIHLLCW